MIILRPHPNLIPPRATWKYRHHFGPLRGKFPWPPDMHQGTHFQALKFFTPSHPAPISLHRLLKGKILDFPPEGLYISNKIKRQESGSLCLFP
jgi:hypothetical protein